MTLTGAQVNQIADEAMEHGCAWADAIRDWPDEQKWSEPKSSAACQQSTLTRLTDSQARRPS
jgi:hypothetical protein